eukprot:241680_1
MTQNNLQQEHKTNEDLNYNQNLLPNIEISLNNSLKGNESIDDSKSNITKQPETASPNLVQLTQLTDPHNEYIYSPRRTKYITRSSIKSHKTVNHITEDIDMFENSDNKEISNKNFRLGKTNINYNKSPKKKKSVSLQWSFPILGHNDEERNNKIANRNKSKYPDYFTVVSPKKQLLNGKFQQVTETYRVQDTPILNKTIIHHHPNSKKIPKKKCISDNISSPNSILSVLSHLDHNFLSSINIKKDMRWRISFVKLRKNVAISKTEVLIIRDELCKPNPKIFLSGSTRKTPYEQWIKLNDFYLSAHHGPQNNEKHRNLSILIQTFCIKFNSITWSDFIDNNFKLGYNPENWIWNEKRDLNISSPSELQKQNKINLSPIQMDLLSPSASLHFELVDEKQSSKSTKHDNSNIHSLSEKQSSISPKQDNSNIHSLSENKLIRKNIRTEFYDPVDLEIINESKRAMLWLNENHNKLNSDENQMSTANVKIIFNTQ